MCRRPRTARAACSAGIAWFALACVSAPRVSGLPERADALSLFAVTPESVEQAARPAPELAWEARDHDGITGVALEFVIEGGPEEVLAMLLDFEHMTGHRSIAREFELLERGPDHAVAVWHLERYKFVRPSVTIGYEAERDVDGSGAIELRYRLLRGDLGVAELFGSKLLLPLGDERTFVRWTNHVATGLALLTIGADEIARKMLEDVELLRAWMQERRLDPGRRPGS